MTNQPSSAVDLIASLSTELIYINKSDADSQNWIGLKHSHHFAELFYVTGGTGEFLVRDERLPIKKHDVIIVNPNIEHTEISDFSDPLEYFVIGLNGISFISDEDTVPYVRFRDPDKSILLYLYKAFEEYSAKQEAYLELCRNLIQVILILVLRKKHVSINVSSTEKVQKEVALVKNYIDVHFKSTITLESLAEEAHINKYYLSHLFKKTYGVSPVKYLNQVRMDTAKFLLESTNYSVLEISEIIGFKSQSYFSQTFKREIGLAPLDYRKENRQKARGPV
ncbi:AraC family transcriptional regulator [Paenibacillus macerans]|uniref:helix-turn-helix transcriptional regulator n=1 Tax=Paenibacillus macerans TaxID=44252 RepID=UPI003D3100E1